ncbi:CvfB family protein [Actomonas aquatica]|uniref:S1-like domain-containing RNA-binding protein n=1 Tax=Actomonas aquatica TaxID=2866162 RepID=A0ABZ1C3M3_9BACT|nr:S1-like domain-containing RNA-binding protein [Opitutus sp. WL0086]WRQ85878.1 S1-like domain-containing RNA-binding protein [Opitutus sp. WL0086]
MAFIGKRNRVRLVREAPQGFYVDGEALGEVLLPTRWRTPDMRLGDEVEVFVYRDSDDRLVATTAEPLAVAGEFAYLRVVAVDGRIGAFLDWGLEKDLLLPRREWPSAGREPRVGDWLIVRVHVDHRSHRVVASARIGRHLSLDAPDYADGQVVDAMVEAETELGYRVIINHEHRGLLYHSDFTEPLAVGQTLEVYVRQVREDGKVDLTPHASGYGRIRRVKAELVDRLAEAGGWLPFHDGSAPEAIRTEFGVSKKAFKQAVGALLREGRITLEPGGIRRVRSDE